MGATRIVSGTVRVSPSAYCRISSVNGKDTSYLPVAFQSRRYTVAGFMVCYHYGLTCQGGYRMWTAECPDVDRSEMLDGIEIETARCPRCASTSIYSFGPVKIERACEPKGGGWRATGRVVRCARCGQELDSVQKVIEVEVSKSLKCQDCGKRAHLRADVKDIKKKSDTEWEFVATLYCVGGTCRARRLLRQIGNLLMLKKIKIGLDGIEFERDTGSAPAPIRSGAT